MSTFYDLILQKAKYKSGGDTPTPPQPTANYFYVEDVSGGANEVWFTQDSGATKPTLEYSNDGAVWQSWTDPYTEHIKIAPNGKVYMRGRNNVVKRNVVTTTAKFNVGGDLTTLLVPEGNVLDLSGRDECFNEFFKDSQIINAKKLLLPSNILTERCYGNMFENCSSLIQAPELPAMQLANVCYILMFSGCSSLTQAPELPAMGLYDYCYGNMFENCSSLTQAPKLPAMQLAPMCYRKMFSGCSSLIQAPELPAKVLVHTCYQIMFLNCTLLNKVEVGATSWNENYTSGWLEGTASSGTIIKPKELTNIPTDSTSGIPIGWTVQDKEEVEPFYLQDVSGVENQVTLGKTSSGYPIALEYSTDKNVWNEWADIYNTPLTIPTNGKLYFRGDNNSVGNNRFSTTQNFNVGGDITTLIQKNGNVLDLTNRPFSFEQLFWGSKVVEAKDLILPSLILNGSDYTSLFGDCHNLISVPICNAEIIKKWSFLAMFQNCTSLNQTLKIKAKELADSVFVRMYEGCTSLTKTPQLNQFNELKEGCFLGMFKGCENIIESPSLPYAVLKPSCYLSMFENCTKLKSFSLWATTLADSACKWMLKGCIRLDHIYVETLVWDVNCTFEWVAGVAKQGNFTRHKELQLPFYDHPSAKPEGWSETIIPDNAV